MSQFKLNITLLSRLTLLVHIYHHWVWHHYLHAHELCCPLLLSHTSEPPWRTPQRTIGVSPSHQKQVSICEQDVFLFFLVFFVFFCCKSVVRVICAEWRLTGHSATGGSWASCQWGCGWGADGDPAVKNDPVELFRSETSISEQRTGATSSVSITREEKWIV